MKRLIQRIFHFGGYQISRINKAASHSLRGAGDFSGQDQNRMGMCLPYTMTGEARMQALQHAVNHVMQKNIPGDIVECGVWRGGSMMLVAKTLADSQQTDRLLWLYDTYEGMSEPTERDRSYEGQAAHSLLQSTQKGQGVWCEASLADVAANMKTTGYPMEKLCLVQGKVEDTIPARVPDSISLLRLDTDWYESTRHELEHLYPLLVSGGILIIDDYGHWEGCRKAVDEYFSNHGTPFLFRIDYTGRMLVKK